jgi:hypothetical protein
VCVHACMCVHGCVGSSLKTFHVLSVCS